VPLVIDDDFFSAWYRAFGIEATLAHDGVGMARMVEGVNALPPVRFGGVLFSQQLARRYVLTRKHSEAMNLALFESELWRHVSEQV
jgi:hypothetical protein